MTARRQQRYAHEGTWHTPRRIALGILNAVDKKESTPISFWARNSKNRPELSSRDKAFITELVYGVPAMA
jgi:hypothetical protein